MQRRIYKYAFTDDDCAALEIPAGEVVLVAAQDPSDSWPTVWVEVDRNQAGTQILTILGTGHAFPADRQLSHVGSAVCGNGELVWHVYEVAQ